MALDLRHEIRDYGNRRSTVSKRIVVKQYEE